MKKFLLFLVLLPLVSFGGLFPDFVEFVNNPTNLLFFRGFTYTSTGIFYYRDCNGTRDTLTSFVINSVPLGVVVNPSSFWVNSPSGDNEIFESSPSIDYCVTRYYDRSRWYSLDYLPDIYDSLHICCNLICSGYRSPAVEIIYESDNSITCNFIIGEVFNDVLTGTNTNFRSQLLSQLSNVNGSLQTLALSLASVSSDYKTVNNLYLNPSKDTLLASAANSVTLNGDSGGAQNLTRLYSDAYAGRESEITKALSDLARSQLQSVWLSTLDPESPFYGHNIDDILNDPAKFQNAVSQGGGGGGSSLANIMRDVKRLTTNDWASAVTNQLANNTSSITNQLAHMFDEGTSMGSALANLQDRSLQTADNTASIDSRLANGITVAVVNQGGTSVGVHLDGPLIIEQSQWQSLSSPIGGLSDTLDSLYGDLSTFYNWGDSTTDWASYFHMMYDFKAQNHSDLSSLSNSFLSVLSVTSSVDRIYDYLSGYQSNSLYQIASSLTNCIGEYYFTRFRRANEFLDENELPFSVVDASDSIFGRGFDEGEFSNLNWFSRMELLLFQLQRVNDTTNVLEYSDIEGELDDSVEGFNSAGTDFVNASRRVVGLFGFITRFADSVKLAFQNSASPSTGGIVLLDGGSWLVDEPLLLNVPVSVQNALRLVFQCIWYLSAAVIAWRIVSSTWDKVITFIRWLWSVFDV